MIGNSSLVEVARRQNSYTTLVIIVQLRKNVEYSKGKDWKKELSGYS
jgi:hypothetical protein